MKRFGMIVAALLMFFTMATPANAAPKPDDANHPAFPQVCSGGPFDGTVVGWTLIANGAGVANGTLPTGWFYEGGTATTPPDFTTVDPIRGVSMYRTVLELDDQFAAVSFTGQSRSNGNGHKAPDVESAITDGIDRVASRWDVATCEVTIPGFILAGLYPDADPAYVLDHFYVITNYVK